MERQMPTDIVRLPLILGRQPLQVFDSAIFIKIRTISEAEIPQFLLDFHLSDASATLAVLIAQRRVRLLLSIRFLHRPRRPAGWPAEHPA
jgi:hypothetical protein